jgi:hypothetical protein
VSGPLADGTGLGETPAVAATTPYDRIGNTYAASRVADPRLAAVIHDVLGTHIDPEDSILELRWNNFNHSLFPALHQGLALLAGNDRFTEGTP